jgi:hypothetical protein
LNHQPTQFQEKAPSTPHFHYYPQVRSASHLQVEGEMRGNFQSDCAPPNSKPHFDREHEDYYGHRYYNNGENDILQKSQMNKTATFQDIAIKNSY